MEPGTGTPPAGEAGGRIGRDRGFLAPDNYALSSALELALLP